MTSSRIGRGAIVTLGAAASMAWAAGAANACDNTPQPPKPTNPHTHGHTDDHSKTHTDTVCTVQHHDVQYAELAKDGSVVGGWHNAVSDKFKGNNPEPVYGYQVRLNPQTVEANCAGTVDVSLASYNAGGPTWKLSGGAQQFVDYAHVKLSTQSKTSTTQTVTVKLPGTPGSNNCYGQIDLYFGTTIYDGGSGPGHGPLPNHDAKPHPIAVPTGKELLTAWNGGDAGGCVVTPPTTTPPTTPPTSKPSTPPTTPTTPKSTTSTPAAPPATTTTPGTPTLAHTGSNAGELSLVALAFFGAGGTAMFASRKAKAAGVGARRH